MRLKGIVPNAHMGMQILVKFYLHILLRRACFGCGAYD
jgi:hypothetical protein